MCCEYKNSKLCKGFGSEYKPCEYIDSCKLCVNYAFDRRQGNNNELYMVFDVIPISCKRDNPDFKPFDKNELIKRARDEKMSEKDIEDNIKTLIYYGIVVWEVI